ncbi:MAG: exopolysaccharide transport family protein [Pseudomonadota bacterium]
MSVRSPNSHAEVDILSVFGALRRWLPRLLIVSVLAGAATYGILSTIAPSYVSEAQIALVEPSTNPFPSGDAQNRNTSSSRRRLDKEAVNTHVRALQAPELLLRVAGELNLAEQPEFNAARGPVDRFSRLMRATGLDGPVASETDEDRVLAAVSSRLQVSVARESRYISIAFSATDPALAARFANKLADLYRKSLVERPVRETSNVVAALQPKIRNLSNEVIAADAAVERFRARTTQFRERGAAASIDARQIASLTGELTRAETKMADSRAKWQTAVELARSGSAEALPQVQKSVVFQGLIAQRVRLERAVSEASATLLPAHPRMRQLNADLAALRRSIAREVAQVVRGLEKAYRAEEARVAGLKRQIASAKTKVVASSGQEAELKALELAAASKRAELQRLQRQLEDNRTLVVTKSVPVEATVISGARPSGVPVFPKKGSLSALAMAATFLIGLAVAIASEVAGQVRLAGRDPELNHVAHVAPKMAMDRDRLNQAVDGNPSGRADTVSRPTTKVARAQKFVSPSKRTPTMSRVNGRPGALTDIASALQARERDGAGLRSMIVGADPTIDGRAEALTVAEILRAGGQSVLIIDWDLSGNGSPMLTGVSGSAGVSDLLTGAAALDDVITALVDSTVHVLPAGSGSSANEKPDTDDLNMLLDALDDVYDQVIITGCFADCLDLFETIQGRFDAAAAVYNVDDEVPTSRTAENSFLGFDVTDIVVYNFQRSRLTDADARLVGSGVA